MSHEKSYTTQQGEKAKWPPGPWTNEPDKVQWVDDATNLDCLAVRNGGAWCGYVGVPPSHPYFGKDYSDVDTGISVHGGLTFSGACRKGGDPSEGICHVPAKGRPEVHWLGFDCNHSGDLDPSRLAWNIGWREKNPQFGPQIGDNATYRTLDYVRGEVASLAKQLAQVTT